MCEVRLYEVALTLLTAGSAYSFSPQHAALTITLPSSCGPQRWPNGITVCHDYCSYLLVTSTGTYPAIVRRARVLALPGAVAVLQDRSAPG